VIPDEARLHVDCRTPPGMQEAEVRARIEDVLGPNGYRLEFREAVVGNASPADSELMEALRAWIEASDRGARCLPTMSTGFTDSRTFRAAFPDCVAYGFFPQQHVSLELLDELVHARNERIDVRDLALAVDCYRSLARTLLG
jgi:acetylornithine deacetylase/succinyl-diaminopimelate desuccinylase-like protein